MKDRVGEALDDLARLIENRPGVLGEVRDLLLDSAVPLELRERLAIALGRSELPAAHDLLISLSRDTEEVGRLRQTAVAALGQQRGTARRGDHILLSGEVAFGYHIEDATLLGKLIDLHESGLSDESDRTLRDTLRGRLAYVLSGNIEDREVVRVLGAGLRRAGEGEQDSALHALSYADPAALTPFVQDLRKTLLETREGSILGNAAGALMKACGAKAEAEIEAVFDEWLNRALRSEESRHEAAVAVSQFTSCLKLQKHRHPWLSTFAMNLLSKIPGEGADALGRFCWNALAIACPDDLAGEGSERVLARIGDPKVSTRAKSQMLIRLMPHRLTADGARRVMDAVLEGSTAGQSSAFDAILAVVGLARSIPDDEFFSWAAKLDAVVVHSLSLEEMARSLRRRADEHR